MPRPIAEEVQVTVLPAVIEAGQMTPTLDTTPVRAMVVDADLVVS